MPFPKIAEMRQKALEVRAKQDEAERIEKCKRMSETMDVMRERISSVITDAATKGFYKTGVVFHDNFDLEKSTVLFCLKKIAEELIHEGYKVHLDTNCKITVMWNWEESK